MGKRRACGWRRSVWVASSEFPRSADNSFDDRLNRVLDEASFVAFVEEQCARFYADGLGRPRRSARLRGGPPISLTLREFLDVALDEGWPGPPGGGARGAANLETHPGVFTWGAAAADSLGLGQGQDDLHRPEDAGGDRGVAELRPPGHG